MSTGYKLPLRNAEAEFIEKKSRFISYIAPVSTADDALAFLRSIREKHREAAHNVYAYRIKNGGISRHSDDGEPSGTAGLPLMDVFIKQDIYDFCCVATRYFGGVLLGAGGLVRAYSRCGVVALEASGIGEMREIALCSVTLPYPLYEQGKRFLETYTALIISEDFGVDVDLHFSLLAVELERFERGFTQLTSGTVALKVEGIKMSIV